MTTYKPSNYVLKEYLKTNYTFLYKPKCKYEVPMTMKIYFTLTMMLIGSMSLAQMPLSSALDTHQEKIVLDLLNETCADSWCEGEYNIAFNAVRTAPDSYLIDYTAADNDDRTSAQRLYSCEVKNKALIEKIILNDGRSTNDGSEAEIFEIIDHCLSRDLAPKPAN